MNRRRLGKKYPKPTLFGVDARMSNSFTSLGLSILFWLSKIAAAPGKKQKNIKTWLDAIVFVTMVTINLI